MGALPLPPGSVSVASLWGAGLWPALAHHGFQFGKSPRYASSQQASPSGSISEGSSAQPCPPVSSFRPEADGNQNVVYHWDPAAAGPGVP